MMPLPDALAAADRFRAELLAQERAAASRMVRAYGDVYQRLQGQLEALTAEVEALRARGEAVTLAQIGRMERLRALRRQVVVEIGRYGIYAEQEVHQTARQLIELSGQHARELTQLALPGIGSLDARIMQAWQSLPTEGVEALMGFLADDSPLWANLRDKLGQTLATQVADELVRGMALGYNPRRIARILRDQLGQGLNWSLVTARTANLYAYREGTRASYLANQRIVPRWTWRSTRDERTCAGCIAMDGQTFPVTERLNDHHNGRCAMIPVPITYRDLGLNVPEPTPVLPDATGEAWFRRQSRGTQLAILGPGKLDAWEAGQFRFDKLSKTYDDPVYGRMRREATLTELLA